jgi:hypothetical protein
MTTAEEKLDQIIGAVADVRVTIAGIEGRLTHIGADQVELRTRTAGDVGELRERVTALEKWRWTIVGVAAAAGVIAGPLLSHLGVVMR